MDFVLRRTGVRSTLLMLALLVTGNVVQAQEPAATATAPATAAAAAPPPAAETPAPGAATNPTSIAAPSVAAAATTAAKAEPLPAPTSPTFVDADKISAGDTAWMLAATALVLIMTIPGLALFYGGMVRKKNVISTMAQVLVVTCVVSIVWMMLGYSLAFMPGTPLLGSMQRTLLFGMDFLKESGRVTVHHSATNIPESVYMMYQMTFAIITPALIVGAFAERMKFSAAIWFIALWSLVVYSPIAHWVWEPSGWLAKMGILDFAGGTVVHINAGIAGLVCALVLGRRVGFRKEPFPPSNLGLTMAGASLLWVGWFGFNAGSAIAADGRAGMAMAVTHVATVTAALSWMIAEWLFRDKPSLLGLCSGAIAGLVAITPAAGYVNPRGALLIGAAAGVFCFWASTGLKRRLGYDDSLDVFGIHAVGGIIGALLTGALNDRAISGTGSSVLTQAIGVVSTLAYSGIMTLALLGIVGFVFGLRVDPEEERTGLDISSHAEQLA